jgi:alpha/beta superfamily hydrolase
MEEKITFDCQGLILEGRLALGTSAKGALITHPHPLYGGDMNDQVVKTVAAAYQSRGWSTLRFNFRGSGASQGRFDNGQGEQLDVDAAIACLKSKGCQTIDLAGYSYGAWVLAGWSQNHHHHPHTVRLVAPPVAFIDFTDIQIIPGLKQVVVGGRDEIAPFPQVEAQMAVWQPTAELSLIQQADHFFGGNLQILQAVIAQSIE